MKTCSAAESAAETHWPVPSTAAAAAAAQRERASGSFLFLAVNAPPALLNLCPRQISRTIIFYLHSHSRMLKNNYFFQLSAVIPHPSKPLFLPDDIHIYTPTFICVHRGIGGAAAEVAKDEAIAKAAAAKAEAAVVRAEADAAADHAAAMARDAAAAEIDGAEGVEGEFKEGCNEVNGVEWNEEKRALLLLCNRVVYHCLGALGIMAVDQKARAMALQVSPNLNFLTHLAVAEFPPPPSLAPPLHPAKPETSSEQEEAEGRTILSQGKSRQKVGGWVPN
eukprot:1147675-Pelagomonas_calceolata.AAC.3